MSHRKLGLQYVNLGGITIWFRTLPTISSLSENSIEHLENSRVILALVNLCIVLFLPSVAEVITPIAL